MFKTRLLSGICLVLILGAAIYMGGFVFWTLLFLVSLIGYHEFCRAIRQIPLGEKYRPDIPEIMGCLSIVCYEVVMYLTESPKNLFYVVIGSMILFMLTYVLTFPKFDSAYIMQICFGILYVVVLLGCLYLIRIRERGIVEILMVFISSWVCDTCAYLAGRTFGKHKLAPVLSPKKSIEGSVGGVLGAVLVGVLLAYAANGNQLIYGAVCGAGAVISQIGDLFASGIKRNRGIKDYGNLIPGHGGILDRFDSVLITAPVVFILVDLLVA